MLPSDFDIFSPVSSSSPLCIHIRANSSPAPRDWASSFSWCGKTRSMPPPWISKTGPRNFSAIAEHSMCHPGRLPDRVLVRLVRLPQREVAGILLQLGALRFLGRVVQRILVALAAGQPAVLRERRDPEVDVAARGIRESAVDELADQLDDLRNRLAGLRLVVGPAQAEQVGVFDVPLRSLGGELGAVARRRRIDLVVD